MPNNEVPAWLKPYIKDEAYTAIKQHIEELDPQSREEMILKYIALKTLESLYISLNGKELGAYNGEIPAGIDIQLGTLTIQKNGETLETYNGSANRTVNIGVPVITYGSGEPTGGNNGDVYMRYA